MSKQPLKPQGCINSKEKKNMLDFGQDQFDPFALQPVSGGGASGGGDAARLVF
jgi:hypothetical protein